jgi:hypothetical protein
LKLGQQLIELQFQFLQITLRHRLCRSAVSITGADYKT